MPKNTDTTDDESDGEQNDKKALTTRAKLAVLALWAWLTSSPRLERFERGVFIVLRKKTLSAALSASE
jgi:hypothetical protein